MELDSDPTEIEVTPGLEGLSRTLRVAEVIRRRDLDFVSKPGELVESGRTVLVFAADTEAWMARAGLFFR